VAAYVDRLSKGEADVNHADTRVSCVCFAVSNLQVDRRFDCARHRLHVVSAPALLLETNESHRKDSWLTKLTVCTPEDMKFITCGFQNQADG